MSVDDVLVETLRFAVPLRIQDLLDKTPTERELTARAWAREAAQAVGHRGDALMFPARRGASNNTFEHLARGLAALAVTTPGGCTYAGLRWQCNRSSDA